MMAACSALQAGAEVILLEKNEKLGKKLYITGKGRCNLTNACSVDEFFNNVLTNKKFIYSAVYSFDQRDTCDFFEKAGLPLKEERGMRIFPGSDKSSDVIKTLEKYIRNNKAKIRLNSKIDDILTENGSFYAVKLADNSKIYADAIVIATGGFSYQSTGSTGDGYKWAEKLGHKIVELKPSLVPLRVEEKFISELEGLSLRNVSIKISDYTDFGEMLFAGNFITGPLILSASAFLCNKIHAGEKLKLSIDLKPALSEEQLDNRILRDFEENKNRLFKNSLDKLLPAKLIAVIVKLSGIREDKKVNEITKAERKKLLSLLKDFQLTVTGTNGFEQAVITSGGVDVKKINPSTMESKLVKNVYFAGEVLDVDAYTGGFNLQIAFSTGHLAGRSAAKEN